MSSLHVSLFGRLNVHWSGEPSVDICAQKPHELFCYLMLNRARVHSREVLADLLWGENSTSRSKQYLRKTLWQLQSALDRDGKGGSPRVILTDSEWVQLNPDADVWLDVAAFEQVFTSVQGIQGRQLDAGQIRILREAVALYRGDLLENCYYDWCLYERERLQHMYLTMLDKLMDYCENQGRFEEGIVYGDLILRYEPARERTYRRLMRLYSLARDRTAALRQYERCVDTLARELGVAPAASTIALYEQLCQGLGVEAPAAEEKAGVQPMARTLSYLEQLQGVLVDIQRQIQYEIQEIKLSRYSDR